MNRWKRGVQVMVIVLISALCGFSLQAQVPLTVSIAPKDGDNFIAASFSYFVPGKVANPRYILVLVPGFNGNGQSFFQEPRWRQLIESSGGAMVTCSFKALPEETEEEIENYVHYAAAQHGSGAALELAIDHLDELDPLHSLKGLPLLIYGHSAGGQFAYGFTCHNPKRMIAFAAAKGGYYYPEPIKETFRVPGLLISGEQDLPRRKKEIRNLFESHRREGAPWCWMEDAYGHGTAKTLDVILPYFRELLRMRIASDSKNLREMSREIGVTVDLQTKTLLENKALAAGKGVELKTGFLPSVNVFKVWAEQDVGVSKYVDHSSQTESE